MLQKRREEKRREEKRHCIKVFDEIKDTIDDSYGIVLAMNESNSSEVAEYLRLRNVVSNVFHYPKFISYLNLCEYHRFADTVIYENGSIKSIGDYKLRKDTFYIVCPAHIGDTLFTASLVRAFKKEHKANRICLIVQNGHSDIPDFFDSVDEKLVSDKLVEICLKFSIFRGIWICQNYLYADVMVSLQDDFSLSLLPEYADYLKLYKNDLPFWRKSVMHVNERSEHERIKHKKENNCLENYKNSIILAPYAQSVRMLSASFWEKLANNLAQEGYVVYTNVKDDTEQVVKNTHPMSKPLADMPAIAEKCRLVIALRSGLCDLLAFTKAKMVVIDTEEGPYKWWWHVDIFDDMNMKHILLDAESDDEKNVMMILRKTKLLV